jgi:kumamolisin
MDEPRAAIAGSEASARQGDRWLHDAPADESTTVTLFLRHSGNIAQQLLSGEYRPLSREDAERSLAATPADLAAVRAFAEKYGLQITQEDPASRRVRLEGTASDMERAFGIKLGIAEDASGHRFRTYRGAITVPGPLRDAVTAVLGLDQRPIARHAEDQ